MILEGPEARHAVTVSRLALGERISIGNGAGLVATGIVVVAEHTRLEITVEAVDRSERAHPAVFLAQALAKGDRDELAVQAATELGVDGVIPWAAARSISRWEGAKVAKGRQRWMAVVREAAKQSLRAWLPDVLDLSTTKQLAALSPASHLVVLDPTAAVSIAELELDDRDVVVLVGPEGGVADHELAALVSAGSSTVRLGTEVLRTSTAGPAAIAVLNVRLGRWRAGA
ncbi:MAG: 16S rRNA (uracil(1498)-N(3))-methyltransferase [Salinibacterium sp.]|nr:16S rRNA (uracil(1498)-N(3))-methyltransferase [Salinibacterium sp.]